jgi:hypothetical protein
MDHRLTVGTANKAGPSSTNTLAHEELAAPVGINVRKGLDTKLGTPHKKYSPVAKNCIAA